MLFSETAIRRTSEDGEMSVSGTRFLSTAFKVIAVLSSDLAEEKNLGKTNKLLKNDFIDRSE